MTMVNKYRLWCTTENAYFEEWAEAEPTDCPNDSGHGVDATKTAILEKAGDEAKLDAQGRLMTVGGTAFDKAAGINSHVIGVEFTAKASKNSAGDLVVDSKSGWDILEGSICIADALDGDSWWMEVCPNLDINAAVGGDIGKVAAAAGTGDSVVTMKPGTVATMVAAGLLDEGLYVRFRLTDPESDLTANTPASAFVADEWDVPQSYLDDVRKVKDFDEGADTITLTENLPAAISVDDKLWTTVRPVGNRQGAMAFPGMLMEVGRWSREAKNAPLGKRIRFIAKTASGTDVVARGNLVYLAGRVT